MVRFEDWFYCYFVVVGVRADFELLLFNEVVDCDKLYDDDWCAIKGLLREDELLFALEAVVDVELVLLSYFLLLLLFSVLSTFSVSNGAGPDYATDGDFIFNPISLAMAFSLNFPSFFSLLYIYGLLLLLFVLLLLLTDPY